MRRGLISTFSIIIASIILIISIVLTFKFNMPPFFESNEVLLDGPFSLYINDVLIDDNAFLPYENDNLKDIEMLKISIKLPSLEDNTHLLFKTSNDIIVFVDGNIVYSFFNKIDELYKKEKEEEIAHIIHMKESYSNKNVEVSFLMNETNNKISITPLNIATESLYIENFGKELPAAFFCLLLFVLSIEGIIIAFYFKSKKRIMKQILSFSFALFCISLWIFSQIQSLYYIIRNPIFLTELNSFAIYIFPFAMVQFIQCVYILPNKFNRYLTYTKILFPIAFCIVFLLRILGITSYSILLNPIRIVIGCYIFIIFSYLSYLYFKGRKKFGKIILSAIILFISYLIDLVTSIIVCNFIFIKTISNHNIL